MTRTVAFPSGDMAAVRACAISMPITFPAGNRAGSVYGIYSACILCTVLGTGRVWHQFTYPGVKEQLVRLGGSRSKKFDSECCDKCFQSPRTPFFFIFRLQGRSVVEPDVCSCLPSVCSHRLPFPGCASEFRAAFSPTSPCARRDGRCVITKRSVVCGPAP